MTTQLVEKTVTVEDPRDGAPLAITVQLELSVPACECSHTPRKPIGYGSDY
jgi:hypothetical protein